MRTKKYGFLKKNGLSISFLLMAVVCMSMQSYTGWKEYNDFRKEHHAGPIKYSQYFSTGHFLEATFENWESEFLQMALFVIMTVSLRQKGSSESKDLEDKPKDPAELKAVKGSPWPVRKGGIWLSLYKYSLSISLLILFMLSFILHWYGSWIDFNEKQILDGKTSSGFIPYLEKSRFWFESFQNWQSEFLSIFAIIFLSIYLRHWGSSQSKPVNMAFGKNEN
jgi:hypothetical protein